MKLRYLTHEYEKLSKILNGEYGPITSLSKESINAISLEYINPTKYKPFKSLQINFQYLDSITIDIVDSEDGLPDYILRPFNIAVNNNIDNPRSEIIAGPINLKDLVFLQNTLNPEDEITRELIRELLPHC